MVRRRWRALWCGQARRPARAALEPEVAARRTGGACGTCPAAAWASTNGGFAGVSGKIFRGSESASLRGRNDGRNTQGDSAANDFLGKMCVTMWPLGVSIGVFRWVSSKFQAAKGNLFSQYFLSKGQKFSRAWRKQDPSELLDGKSLGHRSVHVKGDLRLGLLHFVCCPRKLSLGIDFPRAHS